MRMMKTVQEGEKAWQKEKVVWTAMVAKKTGFLPNLEWEIKEIQMIEYKLYKITY